MPHTELMEWAIVKTKEKSIEFQAKDIKAPDLKAKSLIEQGYSHYDEMCSGCHGAPGADPAEGFNPAPPALAEAVRKLKPEEVFWVVKNGIKMTAMPEFGSSHTDEELWAIAAFVDKLPGMTESEYNLMKKETEEHSLEHGH